MLRALIRKFDKHRNLLILLVLLVVVFITYGRTLQMYWWVDDWGLVYKMIFPQDAPTPSNFGAGIFGEGAYRYNATPFILLYHLFGLQVEPYFLLGLLQYFLVAAALFVFVKRLSKNNFIAFASSIIFASGYVGSFALYRLSNSYQVVGTAGFLIITSLFYHQYFRTKRKLFYVLTLLSFITTLEFFFLRAQGLIFAVLATAIYSGGYNFSSKSIVRFLKESLPFILLYIFFYFIDYRGGSESSGVSALGFLQIFREAWNPSFLTNFLSTLGALFVPTSVVKGIYGSFLILVFLVFSRRKPLIFFGVVLAIGNIITYFLYNPYSSLDTNSRYLVPAFVGSAIAYSAFLGLIKPKAIRYLLLSLICFSLIYLTNKEAAHIVKYVSRPDKEGYALLKNEVKNANTETIFFVESIDDPNYKNNILGGVPQMAIPPLFGFRGVAKMAYSYEELYRLFGEGRSLDNFYSYFYSMDGYRSTTDEIRKLLTEGDSGKELKVGEGKENKFEFDVDYQNMVSNIITLTMTVASDNKGRSQKVTLWWISDRFNEYRPYYSTEFEVINDGRIHEYKIEIPPQGTKLRKIKIDGLDKNLNINLVKAFIKTK